MSSIEISEGEIRTDCEIEDGIKLLEEEVKRLYYVRNHYFATHTFAEASKRQEFVEGELNKTLEFFEQYKNYAHTTKGRARYFYLKGYALNILMDYNKDAEELLSKAIKLDPKIVEAWVELGECYSKRNNMVEAENCFKGALALCKNKSALRNLSIITRMKKGNTFEDIVRNIEKGLELAKEAVALDPEDGFSWTILGNAHLNSFFGISQNPVTLKSSLSAYKQAEKDIVARHAPDLHYNKGTMLKYTEEYLEALQSYEMAIILDPPWELPKTRKTQLQKYLKDITDLVAASGKLKAKKLTQLINQINEKQLGPYLEGEFMSDGRKVKFKEIALKDLKCGKNKECVVLGKVVCSVLNEETVPFTFCIVDKQGTCVVVTLYNLTNGKGVIIGDSVAIPEPYVTDVDIKYSDNVYKFRLLRVDTPMHLVINGRRPFSDWHSGVQLSMFRKYD